MVSKTIYKSLIAEHFWNDGRNFNFHQAKDIFKFSHISEIDFLENIAIISTVRLL